jgi:hypothetical protein
MKTVFWGFSLEHPGKQTVSIHDLAASESQVLTTAEHGNFLLSTDILWGFCKGKLLNLKGSQWPQNTSCSAICPPDYMINISAIFLHIHSSTLALCQSREVKQCQGNIMVLRPFVHNFP